MWFSLFEPVGYRASEVARGWPAAPRHFDRAHGRASMATALELMELAHAVGFDSLTLAEHHYAPRQLTPDPIVMAAAVSQRIPGAYLTVMGTDLPLHNPVAVAERYAMLDNMLDGRLYVGLFRGTPNEYVTFGTNPAQSRAMFEEGVRLVKRAWTEPEPFGWEGVHYRYRTVATWPQPAQNGHPRLLTSAGSPESAIFAARERMDIGFFAMPVEVAAQIAEVYRQEACRCGWEPTEDNILYRALGLVADTDEAALELAVQHDWGHFQGILEPTPERTEEFAQLMGGVLFGGWAQDPEKFAAAFAHNASRLPPLLGSPQTVARRLREMQQVLGFGRFDLITSGDLLPKEASVRSLQLFGEQVIPQFAAEPAGNLSGASASG
jgi:alkanesulfonate monooxygenase SsuD/methylene tetrahydromethanopterin reductase-like flavin-dependent oxidoreductase (luciferase family)